MTCVPNDNGVMLVQFSDPVDPFQSLPASTATEPPPPAVNGNSSAPADAPPPAESTKSTKGVK